MCCRASVIHDVRSGDDMKRIATAIVVLLVLAAIGLFAAVVPDEMPDGMWEAH